MTEKNKDEKKPLDMTSDEAIDYLFGQETADKLREIAKGDKPPNGSDEGMKAKSKSAHKHSTS